MKYIVMSLLCVATLSGCMTPEERARYEQAKRQELVTYCLKMVEESSSDAQLSNIVLGLTTGDIKFEGGEESWKACDYPEEVRIAAMKKMKEVRNILKCGLYSAKIRKTYYNDYYRGNSPVGGIEYECRLKGDKIRKLALEKLSTFSYEEINRACICLPGVSWGAWQDRMIAESLALQSGQKELAVFLKDRVRRYWSPDFSDIAELIVDMSDDLVAEVFIAYYGKGYELVHLEEKSDQMKRSTYEQFMEGLIQKLKNKEAIRKAVAHVARQEIIYPDNYAFAFEQNLIRKFRKEIIVVFGDDVSLYPKNSNLARFASLLYTDEERKVMRAKVLAQRGTFNGVFGKKFGDVMSTDGGVRVTRFGADFYRVPFEPAKKSDAFTHYYAWLTPVSHKIFEIEARSDSALAFQREEFEVRRKDRVLTCVRDAAKPDVVLALEKKYGEYFARQDDAYVLQFPEEKCQMTVLANLRKSISGSRVAHLFVADVFGQYTSDPQGAEKVRKLEDYNFSSVENVTRALVFAESVELYKLAKEETNAERAKQAKAAADKQKTAAQNAADAF